MQRLSAARIGVAQGSEEVFSDFASGGEMWTGSGARERRHPVRFVQPFRAVPVVHVGLALWDMGQGANIRAEVAADRITETGFELVFRTWADTRVARVRMNWLAIGEVLSEDDWELY